ncbi:MAG: hypothetical protein R2941_08935, partial [Desulfobacterales bacterium]
CSRLTPQKNFRAKIKNYSTGGIYYESDEYVEKGTMIFYKIEDVMKWIAAPEKGRGMRTVSLAEVECCREIEKRDRYRYGTNVRYYKFLKNSRL